MKQLTIISGKGGTGKTTITAAFAALAHDHVMADGDVDAADLHLILNPHIQKQEDFFGGRVPSLDRDKCDECGICMDVCRFDAIHDLIIDPISCEGCGLCMHACPYDAIAMEEKLSGQWFLSITRFGPMVYAKLGIAEENSGKLVTLVRQQAKLVAEKDNRDLVIIDGPPGIGCPVIAAITGVNLVLVVTEPTLSGIHDLERVLDVAKHFNIPGVVCINKYDINLENSRTIKEYCHERSIEVVGEIPYDPIVTKAMVQRKSIVEYDSGMIVDITKNMWGRINGILQNGSQK
ncbi:MAG: ATP-binding protein [Thermodesulfobacteriota bacterium]|nr:ATP-binding protein [Thermodesulfobacteriota bacterium]